jgi:hypothetical protein
MAQLCCTYSWLYLLEAVPIGRPPVCGTVYHTGRYLFFFFFFVRFIFSLTRIGQNQCGIWSKPFALLLVGDVPTPIEISV